MTGNEGFFDVPDDIVQNGRYRITDPATGTPTLVSRASNTTKSLDNSFALGRSRLRKTIKGLTKRPDILRRLLTTTDPDTIPTKDIDDMLTSALACYGDSLEGSNSGSNEGTAAHNVLQQVDEGVPFDKIPEEYHPLARAYIGELQRKGLTPVATELTLYNSRFKRVGRCDNVYRDRSGQLVIGDKKTTRWLEYAKNSIAAQTGIYNSADFVSAVKNPNADAEFVPITDANRPIDTYSILVLIDLDHDTVTLYRVDTEHGRRGAVLEAQVKAWANTDGIILPYVPPAGSSMFGAEQMLTSAPNTGGTQHTSGATPPLTNYASAPVGSGSVNNAGAIAPSNGAVVGPLGVETNLGQLPDPATPQVEPRQATAGPAFTTAYAPAQPQQPVLTPAAVQPGQLSAVQLAALPKPELQQMLSALGGTDLNHHRKWLAEKIVELRSGVAPTGAGPGIPPAAPTGDPFGNPAPVVDPQAEAARKVVTAIQNAASVTDIRKIYDMVVGTGAAWTDQYTTAARTRAEEIDNQPVAASPDDSDGPIVDDSPPNQELDVMARIASVTAQSDLAGIWTDVTDGGNELGNWTTEIQAYATKRLAELATPAPTANPFG